MLFCVNQVSIGIWEAATRVAGSHLRRASSVLVGNLMLCLLYSAGSPPAQRSSATNQGPTPHQPPQPPRISAKNSPNSVQAASTIQFENIIERSKVTFKLNNSVSPQHYTFETMTGGVALFDYNNDGLLDIFFINGAEIPSLQKSDANYANRLFRNNGDGTFTAVTRVQIPSGTPTLSTICGIAAFGALRVTLRFSC